MTKNLPVIFDNGSGFFKAGFSEDFNCSVNFPTIVGTPKNENLIIGMDQKDFFVGNEANTKRNLLNIKNPIKKGLIQDWSKMLKIWEYTYEHELVIDPQDNPILTTLPPNTEKTYREKMAEIFFESLKVEDYYFSITSVLALYASGKTTGLVLESGEGTTHAVPIYEGFAIPFGTIKLDIGGGDLTEYLVRLLQEENCISINPEWDGDIFRKIKEKFCYITSDYDSSVKEYQKTKEKVLATVLPDGTKIFLSDQNFKCPEILFQPNKLDKDFYGIHEAVYQSILRCNQTIRKELYSSILLSGGNTMFPGINKRLFKEISALAPSTMEIKTKAPQERKNSVWIGGSILCSLNSFRHMWITGKEYREQGESVIHRKII